MWGRQVAIGILDQVQKLYQKIALARAGAQQRLHIGQGRIAGLPALCMGAPTLAATPRCPDAVFFIKCHDRLPNLPVSPAFAAIFHSWSISRYRCSIDFFYYTTKP